jgi:hypothetical protein
MPTGSSSYWTPSTRLMLMSVCFLFTPLPSSATPLCSTQTTALATAACPKTAPWRLVDNKDLYAQTVATIWHMTYESAWPPIPEAICPGPIEDAPVLRVLARTSVMHRVLLSLLLARSVLAGLWCEYFIYDRIEAHGVQLLGVANSLDLASPSTHHGANSPFQRQPQVPEMPTCPQPFSPRRPREQFY